ncbi:MAG: MATE family efflux transporter, partial [Eubacterium sp.]|nr:MATE family efflux transporter [Eubacterium sp.]
KQTKDAPYYIGNALALLFVCGIIIGAISLIFLEPLLIFFGSPGDVLPYAKEYVSITAIGFPFLMVTLGGGHLIRADGSPGMTMVCSLSGAIINTILDAVFVLGFNWGMKGAALATVIGQVISFLIVIHYMTRRFKTVKLELGHLRVQMKYVRVLASIGMGSFFNQIAMMVVQIVLNNSLKKYGGASVYGESIPVAVAGIVTKVAQVFFSIVIGIVQGTQPIISFNYGARNYKRVREAYKVAMIAGLLVSILAFLVFQLMPRQVIALFGEGSEAYFAFAVNYFRIYMFFILLNFIQPITATFFTSIGKAFKGAFLSLTRQILFFLPLIVILPHFMGIDGILYAAPISDFMALVATVIMAVMEFKNIAKLERGEMNGGTL